MEVSHLREPTFRGHDHIGRPHLHATRRGARRYGAGNPDELTLALSIERPGHRAMRGLAGGPERGGPGPGGPGPGGRGPRRHDRGDHRPGRHQARRGAVRPALLRVLADQPMHGYQIMQVLGERTGGRWRPSAGSIYPTLQQLEDEGLIASTELDGRRVYDLTDAGRAAVADMPTERAWPGRQDGARDLRGLGREVAIATMQVDRMGSAAAIEAAATILTTARRDLYRLLADDPGVGGSEPASGAEPAAASDPAPAAEPAATTQDDPTASGD
jgi:DNA-binding PadR family transcriptional regulator